MSPVRLPCMINQNVVIDTIAIDHEQMKETWDSFSTTPMCVV